MEEVPGWRMPGYKLTSNLWPVYQIKKEQISEIQSTQKLVMSKMESFLHAYKLL